jgi:dipeptidyl aminopeptidase/acylaminoacyl peptidase
MRTPPPLIDRNTLFGNPDRAAPRLSPDGRRLSFLAEVDGVLNIWVGPADDPDAAAPVTADRDRGIRQYFWAYTGTHLLYVQDKGGDENWRVYSVALDTGRTLDLTPFDGVQARVEELSHRCPEEILVSLNNRTPELHDLYRVNVRTGERTLIYENEGLVGFTCDDDLRLRVGMTMRPDGGCDYLQRQGDEWAPLFSVDADDALTTGPLGFDESGTRLLMLDSRDRNTAALVELDPVGGATRLLAQDERADLSDTLRHPTLRHVQAVAANYERRRWQVLDPALEPDFTYLATVCDGELDVVSRTLDDHAWIVAYVRDNGPVQYYRYDRTDGRRTATFLFSNRRALEQATLARMHPVVIPARDGLPLVSYLTLPPQYDDAGRPTQPLPLVLLVHGGPWHRDEWGYDPEHQWLANRGYAVLSVNFRGSTGFGKAFLNAANREFAGRMHDDLLDAVSWAVQAGVADPARVAIMGGSYGGYATLVGLTFTPDVFACGIDIVGMSNLVTLLESIPDYWKPMVDMFTTRVGDHRTEDGRRFLLERSPLSRVDQIRRPLLIAQGANDPRVKQAESDQIVSAMQSRDIPVTYVLYPDEGHGFVRPVNRLSFYAIAEAFLARHLGGRCEPIGTAFDGASLKIEAGADQIPGLA